MVNVAHHCGFGEVALRRVAYIARRNKKPISDSHR